MSSENPGRTTVGDDDGELMVRGRAVLQVVRGIPDHAEQKARSILADNGIEHPEPDAWYPRSSWLRTFETIEDRIGEATLQQIGETVVDNVDWPADTTSFPDCIEVVDRAYRANHRGGDPGGYDAEPTTGATIVHCDTPHPEAFDRAVVKATAREFRPDAVSRVEEVPDARGDPSFEVTWWSVGG